MKALVLECRFHEDVFGEFVFPGGFVKLEVIAPLEHWATAGVHQETGTSLLWRQAERPGAVLHGERAERGSYEHL